MYKNARNYFLIMIFSLLLTSCSLLSKSTADELDGTHWNLLFIRKSTPLPESTITITFSNGEVRGNSGCNTFLGEYQIREDEISFTRLAATEIACLGPEGIMQQEQQFLLSLSEIVSYSIEGDRLTLKKTEQDQLTFERVMDR